MREALAGRSIILAGVSHSLSDSIEARTKSLIEQGQLLRTFFARALLLEQRNLKQVQGVDVGISQIHGLSQELVSFEEALAAPNGEQGLHHLLIFRTELLEELAEVAQFGEIELGDGEIGFGADHLDLAQKVVEEGPGLGHLLQELQSSGFGCRLRKGVARPQPGREHEARLRPTKIVGDRADARHRSGALVPVGGARSEMDVAELFDWRGREENLEQLRLVVNDFAKRLSRIARQLFD